MASYFDGNNEYFHVAGRIWKRSASNVDTFYIDDNGKFRKIGMLQTGEEFSNSVVMEMLMKNNLTAEWLSF